MKLAELKTLIVLAVLVVVATGCQKMTGKTAGQNVDDASITASVKAKLAADKAATLTQVDVDTNNAVVSLNGVVESPEQRARAEAIARDVKGVQRVVNNLQVKRSGG